MSKLSRTRDVVVSANSNYTLDVALAANYHYIIHEIFISTNTSGLIAELLYSEDNGETFINPWDDDGEQIVRAYLAAYIPVYAQPKESYLIGGTNKLARIKFTNPTGSDAKVSFILNVEVRSA